MFGFLFIFIFNSKMPTSTPNWRHFKLSFCTHCNQFHSYCVSIRVKDSANSLTHRRKYKIVYGNRPLSPLFYPPVCRIPFCYFVNISNIWFSFYFVYFSLVISFAKNNEISLAEPKERKRLRPRPH